jgi:probable phosphoglycerate mutase
VANVADRTMQAEPEGADRLSDRGHEQARGLGKRLEGVGIESIVASPFGRAQETAQGIGDVLGLPFDTDEDLYEVRQSDAYRAASPHYEGTGHVSWMPRHPAEHAEPGAESFAQIVARVRRVQLRLEQRMGDERILCVSHWGFLHFFLGVCVFREAFAPEHLPALYRISHMNTGITIFHNRGHWPIEGLDFAGWSLQTWNVTNWPYPSGDPTPPDW